MSGMLNLLSRVETFLDGVPIDPQRFYDQPYSSGLVRKPMVISRDYTHTNLLNTPDIGSHPSALFLQFLEVKKEVGEKIQFLANSEPSRHPWVLSLNLDMLSVAGVLKAIDPKMLEFAHAWTTVKPAFHPRLIRLDSSLRPWLDDLQELMSNISLAFRLPERHRCDLLKTHLVTEARATAGSLEENLPLFELQLDVFRARIKVCENETGSKIPRPPMNPDGVLTAAQVTHRKLYALFDGAVQILDTLEHLLRHIRPFRRYYTLMLIKELSITCRGLAIAIEVLTRTMQGKYSRTVVVDGTPECQMFRLLSAEELMCVNPNSLDHAIKCLGQMVRACAVRDENAIESQDTTYQLLFMVQCSVFVDAKNYIRFICETFMRFATECEEEEATGLTGLTGWEACEL